MMFSECKSIEFDLFVNDVDRADVYLGENKKTL